MLRFPIDALRPRNIAVNLAPRTLGGASSLSGFTQVISPDAGVWRIDFESIAIRNAGHIQTFRVVALRCEGRLNPLLVPVCEGRRQPWPVGGVLVEDIPHSDKALFSDQTGYFQPTIQAKLAADLLRGATEAEISIINGSELLPGHFFSIGDRLYQVRTVEDTEYDIYSITFLPPAREDASLDDPVELQRPVCKCRLMTDDAMRLSLELNRFGSPSVSFIEDTS